MVFERSSHVYPLLDQIYSKNAEEGPVVRCGFDHAPKPLAALPEARMPPQPPNPAKGTNGRAWPDCMIRRSRYQGSAAAACLLPPLHTTHGYLTSADGRWFRVARRIYPRGLSRVLPISQSPFTNVTMSYRLQNIPI
ncbi:hypothetical protein CSAL01_12699 [Colletotrichum salicis]|uniref:Uncharacterized protein n=1 Tax=Colletotrichum salicis TaxID=1209931 RepID=A0A135UZX9_9PEZI|nr:hypothetical protein CSAL01_12699 [Colletotrichum salicis]